MEGGRADWLPEDILLFVLQLETVGNIWSKR